MLTLTPWPRSCLSGVFTVQWLLPCPHCTLREEVTLHGPHLGGVVPPSWGRWRVDGTLNSVFLDLSLLVAPEQGYVCVMRVCVHVVLLCVLDALCVCMLYVVCVVRVCCTCLWYVSVCAYVVCGFVVCMLWFVCCVCELYDMCLCCTCIVSRVCVCVVCMFCCVCVVFVLYVYGCCVCYVVCVCCVSACAHWESRRVGVRAQLPREASPREVSASESLTELGCSCSRGGRSRGEKSERPPALQPSSLALRGPAALQEAGRSRPAPWRDPPRGSWGPTGFSGPRAPCPHRTWGPGTPASPRRGPGSARPPRTTDVHMLREAEAPRLAEGPWPPQPSPAGIVPWRKHHGCSHCCTPTPRMTSTHPVRL